MARQATLFQLSANLIIVSLLRSLLHACGRWLHRWQNWLVGALLVVGVLAGCRLWPHPSLQGWKPSSTAFYDDHGRLLRLTLASDDRYRLWVPLKDMSPQLVDAVLLHEDRWYRWHPGFNPYGLARGAWVTYVRHGNPQGGSTITMQLARSLWQLNTRTPWGKLKQVGRAIQLELFYSKQQILEAYLNDAPYGRNVEGAGAASIAYFNKPVGALSLPEALTLAVIPQDPARRLPRVPTRGPAGADGVINPQLTTSRNRLYARWLAGHPQDASLKPLFALPLNIRPLSRLPFEAPHAVEQLLAARQIDGEDHESRLRTTIDLDLQHTLERQITRYVARNNGIGIRNASAMLVDTRDMGIKAMVGSADYFNRSIQGQVNGTLARRSPGSTLKPFIYALGFDQGVLHPQTVLRDVPTSFGPYTPENFDGHFLGPITATDALNRSRNIPAVWVASQLHQPDLYQFLQQAGIGHLASEQHYGLALVLGGGEVTMQDLAGLYAMLANRGELKPLRLLASDPQVPGTRMLSDEASFMVMDMLRQHLRPDETTGAQPSHLPVYWKTGTSWAFRDAWTAGVFGPYVLIVWVGNFDSTSNQAFVGVDAAAPLFFQIVDGLEAERPQLAEPFRPRPGNVKRVQICLASGELPNQWCPEKGWTWFIPGKSPIRVSNVHRPVVIDDASGLPACPPYTGKRTHEEVYEFWPSDLQQVFAQAGIPRRKPPQNPECRNAGTPDGDPPQITSPVRGSVYAMRLKQLGQERIAFNATTDADAHALYWFVNDAYVGRSDPGTALYWQPRTAGSYSVRAIDDHGRIDQRTLEVGLVD
ncbi:penicillin-binding protein 1C [Paraburkholderia phenazinium]|uniref:peptidoglycan glycosyltransferase n=1 Tax=Paraburkholderia phenazinium TaxID=60549 RepID=A0A1N6JVL5_9BURK|nr:penicillin-binding protein 1C [Paraburkholderia phenazinium]